MMNIFFSMAKAVLVIRDILVRISQRCGSGEPDLHLLLMDPDPDPTLDPTPFFSEFKDATKIYFFHIFFYNLPAGALSLFISQNNVIFCIKFCLKILFCKLYSSQLNTFIRIGKDPEPDPDPYL